jgi:hypothetical protein
LLVRSLEEQLVGVAPPPVVAGFVGADDGVVGVVVPVGGGVPVRRAVAAADVATVHAQPQVYPSSSDWYAVLTPGARGHDVLVDGLEVSAAFSHGRAARLTALRR